MATAASNSLIAFFLYVAKTRPLSLLVLELHSRFGAKLLEIRVSYTFPYNAVVEGLQYSNMPLSRSVLVRGQRFSADLRETSILSFKKVTLRIILSTHNMQPRLFGTNSCWIFRVS